MPRKLSPISRRSPGIPPIAATIIVPCVMGNMPYKKQTYKPKREMAVWIIIFTIFFKRINTI